MNAYNIEILKQSIDDKARFDGWVFGLPPELKPINGRLTHIPATR